LYKFANFSEIIASHMNNEQGEWKFSEPGSVESSRALLSKFRLDSDAATARREDWAAKAMKPAPPTQSTAAPSQPTQNLPEGEMRRCTQKYYKKPISEYYKDPIKGISGGMFVVCSGRR
jgi:hypothetical protein